MRRWEQSPSLEWVGRFRMITSATANRYKAPLSLWVQRLPNRYPRWWHHLSERDYLYPDPWIPYWILCISSQGKEGSWQLVPPIVTVERPPPCWRYALSVRWPPTWLDWFRGRASAGSVAIWPFGAWTSACGFIHPAVGKRTSTAAGGPCRSQRCI